MEEWKSGRMEVWKGGGVEEWKSGKMEEMEFYTSRIARCALLFALCAVRCAK